MIRKKRRREGKTDYKARLAMLKSGEKRVVFRKTNRYIIGQVVESGEGAKDKVIDQVNSKKLLDYGWPESSKGSLKSITAAYLTGYLLAKITKAKKGILDIGLVRNVKKNRAYSFLKGVIDGGIKINAGKDMFPDEKRLKGEHLKNKVEFDKIKQKIDKEE